MTEPTGLPRVDNEALYVSPIDKSRICKDCGAEARIVSNQYGVSAHCGPCKKHWPISMVPMGQTMPMLPPRGISKECWVAPDFDIAFDNIGGNSDETVRPRKPTKG